MDVCQVCKDCKSSFFWSTSVYTNHCRVFPDYNVTSLLWNVCNDFQVLLNSLVNMLSLQKGSGLPSLACQMFEKAKFHRSQSIGTLHTTNVGHGRHTAPFLWTFDFAQSRWKGKSLAESFVLVSQLFPRHWASLEATFPRQAHQHNSVASHSSTAKQWLAARSGMCPAAAGSFSIPWSCQLTWTSLNPWYLCYA